MLTEVCLPAFDLTEWPHVLPAHHDECHAQERAEQLLTPMKYFVAGLGVPVGAWHI